MGSRQWYQISFAISLDEEQAERFISWDERGVPSWAMHLSRMFADGIGSMYINHLRVSKIPTTKDIVNEIPADHG